MNDDGFFSPLDMHMSDQPHQEASMGRAVFLLLLLLASVVLWVIGERLEPRAPVRQLVEVEVPVALPACPRLASRTGRLDLIVIDHVLVYRCGHT